MAEKTVSILLVGVENQERWRGLLQPLYRVNSVDSGEGAVREALSDAAPDLILWEAAPSPGGFDVLARWRREVPPFEIPVILIVPNAGVDEEMGLSLGAVDTVIKPINAAVVLDRVKTRLELRRLRRLLSKESERLERDVMKRLSETFLITNLSVRALACVAEVKDNATGNHVPRTQAYVEILARHLARTPGFQKSLTNEQIDLIVRAAPLHDLGKVGIPDAIVLKTGRLTPEEFEVMKTHTTIGAGAIRKALDQTLQGKDGSWNYREPHAFALMAVAEEIARHHHEKWDGSGYPSGLKAQQIPLSARLMAVSDVCDALQHPRSYRPALGMAQTVQILREGRGVDFDPEIVDAFFVCQDQFLEVARRYPD